jgi:hypothetical protein
MCLSSSPAAQSIERSVEVAAIMAPFPPLPVLRCSCMHASFFSQSTPGLSISAASDRSIRHGYLSSWLRPLVVVGIYQNASMFVRVQRICNATVSILKLPPVGLNRLNNPTKTLELDRTTLTHMLESGRNAWAEL